MKFLYTAVMWVVGALFWSKPANALYGWLGRHKLPVAVFGGAAAVLAAVTLAAAAWGPPDFWKHVVHRNVEMHLFAGAGLYLLFQRVLLAVERKLAKRHDRKWRMSWAAWYLIPFAMVMAISFTQEYGYSLLGDSRGTVGGDWEYNKHSVIERIKSFADNATWFFGSLAAAWSAYFSAERQWFARMDYLKWKGNG